jgi:hypothetical protein
MFWDKKDEERGLPDLPRSQGINQPPAMRQYGQDNWENTEIHELPSFPDSPMQRGFSQSAIKEAVTNDEIGSVEARPLPSFKNQYESVESSDYPIRSPPRMKDNKPIFVRLDKFQMARNSLETVKAKLSEIEELLKRIREVKTREDAELSSWENEMEAIKSRIQTVMNDIFEKAEY